MSRANWADQRNNDCVVPMVVVIVLLGTRSKNQKRLDQKKKEREEEWKETREKEREREKKIGRNNEDTDLHPIRLCPFFRWRN